MDFTCSQIAKLVLGYLKSEKCQKAFDAFLDTSKHLNSQNIRSSKYYVTRIGGYSLEDYLKEYTVVYTIIQERLEATNYFNENCSRSLPDQLLYLLDCTSKSRPNTPLRSRSSTPIKEKHKESEISRELSVIEEDVSNSETNTTPLEDLPGNSDTNSHSKVQKSKSNTSGTDIDDGVEKVEEEDLSFKVLSQLLDYPELHEKLAENINLIRKTSDKISKTSDDKAATIATTELDSAVKAIVQRTEADPVFEKFLDEIIDSVNVTDDDNTPNNLNNESQEKNSVSVSTQSEAASLSTPNKCLQSADTLKNRLRSTKKQSPKEDTQKLPTIEETKKVDAHQNLTVNTNTADIIFYDGSLENYVQASTPMTSTNPLIYNNNLLMVQPTIPQQTTNSGILNSFDASKPYYLMNGSQIVSAPQYKINNLTEQDILSMPTIIVCDNQQSIPTQNVQNVIIPTNPKPPVQKRYVNIAPKGRTEIAENLSEFITLYQSKDANDNGLPVLSPKPLQPKLVAKNEVQTAIHIDVVRSYNETSNPSESTKQEGAPSDTESVQKESEEVVNCENDIKLLNNKTPDIKKQGTKRNLTTPKSGSLSHVRALDFNFGTPHNSLTSTRKANTSPKTCKTSALKSSSSKISKSLFVCSPKDNSESDSKNKIENDTKNTTELPQPIDKAILDEPCSDQPDSIPKNKPVNSWDSELRALTGSISDRCPTPKRKKNCLKTKKCTKKKVDMNQTEIDAQAIETALEQSSAEAPIRETKVTTNNLKKSDTRNATVKRRRKIGGKNTTPKKTVRKQQDKEEHQEKLDTNKQNVPVENSVKVEGSNENEAENVGTTYGLINCNAKARFKKKCNIDNNVKKEVKVTKVKELKSLEFISDGTNKLILSPSKLNANKRNIVTVEDNRVEQSDIKQVDNDNVEDEATLQTIDEELNLSKFITPEMPKSSTHHPITAAKNLTPMLETPIKMDVLKMPSMFSPVNTADTPFTKVFKEQLHGVDLSAIETPKFPLTPTFPYTPGHQISSPSHHRPTDYSTSSSYYQPSDSEQNKSLEQLIEECNRLENKKPTPIKNSNEEEKPSEIVENVAVKETIAKVEAEKKENLVHAAIADKMKMLSQNVIARKNLNLMKTLEDEASSDESASSSGESSDSSDSDTSSDGNWSSKNNATIVQKTSNENNRYSLRSKKVEVSTKSKDEKNSTNTINDIISKTEIKSSLQEKPVSNYQDKVLKQLEEKRTRIIGQLKNESMQKNKKQNNKQNTIEKPPRKMPMRDVHGKFLKTPISRKKKSTSTTNRRKSNTPRRISVTESKKLDNVKQTVNKEIKDDVSHHSDVEQLQPFDVVETELLECSTSSTPRPLPNDQTSLTTFHNVFNSSETEKNKENGTDIEAETLVKGLKEWGIHLIPNKSPQKLALQENSQLDKAESQLQIKDVDREITPETMLTDEKITKEINVEENYEELIEEEADLTDKPTKTDECEADISLEEGEIVSDEDCDASKTYKQTQMNGKNSYIGMSVVEQDLNLSDSIIERTFDVVTFTNHINVTHDYHKKSEKKIEDYNFDLLSKKISANVYIEALDAEFEKFIAVTPNEFILDIPEKVPPQNKKVKILDNIIIPINKRMPFHMPGNLKNNSPLENLYESECNRRVTKETDYKRIRNTDSRSNSRRVSIELKKETTRPSQRYSRSKSLDSKMFVDGKYHDKKESDSAVKSKNVRKDELHQKSKKKESPRREAGKSSHKSTRKESTSKTTDSKDKKLKESSSKLIKSKIVKVTKSSEDDKGVELKSKSENTSQITQEIVSDVTATNSKQKPDMEIKNSDGDMDVIDGIIMLNTNSKDSKDTEGQDLMDYAICGSERIENDDNKVKISSAKRKANENIDCDRPKKPKTNHELVKKIDVASFLAKVHGEK